MIRRNHRYFRRSSGVFLHRPHTEGAGTPREQVVNAWRQEGRLGKSGSDNENQRQTLFFPPGGRYAASELRARASMLETLEASIRLMHEELEVLLREIADHSVRSPGAHS